MTVSNAKLLLQQMQADPSLRTKIKSATEAAFAKATADAGHPTTVAHLNDALHEIAIDKKHPMGPGGGASIVAIVSVAVI